MNSAVESYHAPLAATTSLNGDGNTAHHAEQTQQAAGVLASYMHQEGVYTLDPNALYALAENASGHVSPEVSKAAKFMYKNPDIYAKLETSDVAGRDGISGVANFDFAARGGLASQLGHAQQRHGGHDHPKLTAESAAGTISTYMQEQGIGRLDPNALYQLAMRPNDHTSPGVSAAAKFMLQHPDIYAKIETHDVAGIDGISGAGNFAAAAQGQIQGLHPRAATLPSQTLAMMQMIFQMLSVLQGSQQGASSQGQTLNGLRAMASLLNHLLGLDGKPQPTQLPGNSPDTGRLLRELAKLLIALQGFMNGQEPSAATPDTTDTADTPETSSAPEASTEAANAAEVLADYLTDRDILTAMESSGTAVSDTTPMLSGNQLKALAKDPNAPTEVKNAAAFMLNHPNILKDIEAQGGPQAKGNLTVDALFSASVGLVRGVGIAA